MSARDGRAPWIRIFDRCVDSLRFSGVFYDSSTFRDDLAELLCCAAAEAWYRAVDAAVPLVNFDTRLITRAAVAHTRTAMAAARRQVVAAEKMLDEAVRGYRSAGLDDLGHLRKQADRDAAAPYLMLAKTLLDMADHPEVQA